jgi:uridine monophosphate synthetase
MPTQRQPYAIRATHTKNPLAKKLFNLLNHKKTNLAIAADVTSTDELIELTKTLGSEICVLKTHIDIITDYTPALTKELMQLAKQYEFLIFEDRKFADIGNTVKQQYAGGIYHIADWADIVNAHTLPGAGIIAGLAEVGIPKQRGLLLLASMSSADNLFSEEYSQRTLEMAEANAEFVFGFIAQKKLSNDSKWIYMTPGVQLNEGKDALGQQYITPKSAMQNGSDIIIVGRGITAAKDELAEAKKYRHAGWVAYEDCLSSAVRVR